MKRKKVIAGILLVGILATALAGCKNTDVTKKEREKPVITLGSDSYPPYNYLNEDGIPTGIDVELATEAFKRMGYQVDVVQINWEKKKELVESGEIDCIMGCFSMEGRLDDYRWAGPYIASRQVVAVNEQLEELTLDRETMETKKKLGSQFAQVVYEGKWYTPLREAIQAFVESTQKYVTGEVKIETVQRQHHQSRYNFSIQPVQ